MKKVLQIILICNVFLTSTAQVGINTTSPEGALDVNSNAANTLGMVIPRVPDYNAVTSVSGTTPVNGTIVYDTTLEQLMFYIDGSWISLGKNTAGDGAEVSVIVPPSFANSQTPIYVKASNTGINDAFYSVTLSADGTTLAVGAALEDSSSTGINGSQSNNSLTDSGAVYVYSLNGNIWSQQAYIKASNTGLDDRFGISLSLSDDGNTLAIGAGGEDSNATGVNNDENNNSTIASGAVYIYERNASTWSQQAYIKASNPDIADVFGFTVSLSADGATLAVGTFRESSNATGINGNQFNNSASGSGAVYVYVSNGGSWSQQAYIKASNTGAPDQFGVILSLSDNGNTLAVGAMFENSNSTGINGDENNSSGLGSGAVYVFVRNSSIWSQEAYIKASNTGNGDNFGISLSLSGDASVLAVGAVGEDSNATGINGDQTNNLASASGAVYVFSRSGSNWSQEAYIKASNSEANDEFGTSLSLSSDGSTLAVGAISEDSNSTGINGNETNNLTSGSGAVYVYARSGSTWSQQAYVKSANVGNDDNFGESLSLSPDGSTLAVGAIFEDSSATGINGNQADNSESNSGAVYVYKAE